MDLRCVHCGFRVKTLFVQYSPGNIRLMKCENCKAVADDYIECEIMILLIDLILHKLKAYRHLLYNMLNQETANFEAILWKSSLFFLLLDACRQLLLNESREDLGSSTSSLTSLWTCVQVLINLFIGNFVFIFFLFSGSKFLLKSSSEVIRYKEVFLAILVSSYFKIFLMAMMFIISNECLLDSTQVWEFPVSVLYIIDIFVLSSNAMALKVVTQTSTTKCIAVCLTAHITKLLATQSCAF